MSFEREDLEEMARLDAQFDVERKLSEIENGCYFNKFIDWVKHVSRDYNSNKFVKAFLERLYRAAEEGKNIIRSLPAGTIVYRAVKDFIVENDAETHASILSPSDKDRFRPKPELTKQGRANFDGIPVFYTSSDIKTCIIEMRPWIKEYYSIAKYELLEDIKCFDITENVDIFVGPYFLEYSEFLFKDVNQKILSEFYYHFSKPVSKDDSFLDYVPTQIIAEFLKTKGIKCIAYHSGLVNDRQKKKDTGINYCFLRPNIDLYLLSRSICSVDEISIEFTQRRYFGNNDENR